MIHLPGYVSLENTLAVKVGVTRGPPIGAQELRYVYSYAQRLRASGSGCSGKNRVSAQSCYHLLTE